MKDIYKQEFTRRITNANRSELLVIMFEMFHQDATDYLEYFEEQNYELMHMEAGKMKGIVSELINTLDRQYEISNNLYSLYRFVERQLIEADVKRSAEGVRQADKIMSKLGESFREVAKQDTSAAVMKNTEKVYAGITYGRDDITESTGAGNRGFLA